MGYADTLPYQSVSLMTGARALRTITALPTDQDIADFVFPSFKRPISQAYMDVIIHSIRDTAGLGGNSLQNSGGYGLWDSGKTALTVSNTLSSDMLAIANNAWEGGYYILPGVNNIATAIEPGATQTASFYDIQAVSANLMLYGVLAQIRMYFNI